METTLDRSSLIVVEFFEYCVYSILYQRGIYPREDFEVERKYGMPLLVTNNDELKVYVDQIKSQVRVWLQKGKLSSLVLVIKSKDTGDILERWQFNIEPHLQQQQQSLDNDGKLTNDTKAQIRAIMRQILASVTLLPELDTDDVTFVILVHTDHDVDVPTTWGDSDPKLINGGGEHVRLKHMETSNYKITPIVAYKVTDDDY